AWVRRVASLETRVAIGVTDGPRITIAADGDQLDQLLINIVRNAVDAAPQAGGVRITWALEGTFLRVEVEDDGPGLPESANLFVPVCATTPVGAGIGLVLSRQVAGAHGGSFALENRANGQGCVALIRLPKERHAALTIRPILQGKRSPVRFGDL